MDHNPKNLFGLFLTFYLARLILTLQGLNNPRDVNFMLVLKGNFGGSPKITLQNYF